MSPELREMLFQALGEASMCWSETPKGIFRSDRCKEIGEEVIRAFDLAAEESGMCAKPAHNTPKVEAVDKSAQHTQLAIAARVLLDVYDGQSDLGFVPAIYDLRAALQQQASA